MSRACSAAPEVAPAPAAGAVVSAARIIAYRLPLSSPWRTASSTVRERRGWLVRLDAGDAKTGFGDWAPLPLDRDRDDLAPGLTALQEAGYGITGLEPARALARMRGTNLPPGARFALETALLDLLCRQAGTPLARYLNPRAQGLVRVNGALGCLDGTVPERLERALDDGFTVLKLKLGVHPPREEIRHLIRLAARLPEDVTLRLDANQAWTPETALEVVQALRDLPVDSLEEPLAEPDDIILARLQDRVPWSLALDESLGGRDLDKLLAHPPVRRLVLKPGVLGGLRTTLSFAREAEARGLECVITTSLDSAVGQWGTVHLAAALANNTVHGLATAGWLREDVGPAPQVVAGFITLPEGPGLGCVPYPAPRAR